MRRWHVERRIYLRHWREHSRFAHGNLPTDCRCDDEVGRFRKLRGMGCGRPRCQLCHFEKIHGIKNRHEKIADLRLREQVHNYE